MSSSSRLSTLYSWAGKAGVSPHSILLGSSIEEAMIKATSAWYTQPLMQVAAHVYIYLQLKVM